MGNRGATIALLRFHLRVGVRLALHASVPLTAVFVAIAGLSPDPSAFVGAIALSVATSATDPAIAALLAGLAIGIASWASPRITHGLNGWIRHLPVDAVAHRRAVAASLAAAQAPILALAALCAAGVFVGGTAAVSMAKLAGLPLMALGAGYATLPARRGWLRAPAGAAAALMGLLGSWPLLAVAAALIGGADLVAGPLRPAARAPGFRISRDGSDRAVRAPRPRAGGMSLRSRAGAGPIPAERGRSTAVPGTAPSAPPRSTAGLGQASSSLPRSPADPATAPPRSSEDRVTALDGGVRGPVAASGLRLAPFGALMAWRALGWRIAGPFAGSLAAMGGCALFLSNNRLSPEASAAAVRLGAALAVTILVASLAQTLGVRRPAWPWARSLPWSGAARIALDALFLGALALPLLALATLLDAAAALVVLALLPMISLSGAAAMRTGMADRMGAAGRLMAVGALAALLVALLPWTALLALAATPLVLRAAAGCDRDQKATRWLEIHHLAAGDPLSWRA